jgi:tryptophan halogenase
MSSMYTEIRDFIVLHYAIAKRNDTDFWKAVKHEASIPDTLKPKLDFFAHSLPILDEFTNQVFRERSYTCLLSGMNHLPKKGYPLLDLIGTREGDQKLEEIKRNTSRLVELLPSNYEYLKWLYANSRSEIPM